jgi:hypothetical protein
MNVHFDHNEMDIPGGSHMFLNFPRTCGNLLRISELEKSADLEAAALELWISMVDSSRASIKPHQRREWQSSTRMCDRQQKSMKFVIHFLKA